MNAGNKQTTRVLCLASAGILAVGLTACDQKPSAEQVGKNIDRSVDQASRQIDAAGAAIERKLEQAGQVVDDAALTGKVKSALVAEPGLKSGSINVTTQNGIVILQGATDTIEGRQKAAQVASNVEGVRAVRNEIVVKGT